MIDLTQEKVLSLSEAARAVPKIDGKKPHVSTIWRWCRKGIRGVRLEHVRLGHRVCTSKEAISRFANALAESDTRDYPVTKSATQPKPRPKRSERQREKAVSKANAELKRAGI